MTGKKLSIKDRVLSSVAEGLDAVCRFGVWLSAFAKRKDESKGDDCCVTPSGECNYYAGPIDDAPVPVKVTEEVATEPAKKPRKPRAKKAATTTKKPRTKKAAK